VTCPEIEAAKPQRDNSMTDNASDALRTVRFLSTGLPNVGGISPRFESGIHQLRQWNGFKAIFS
jgi:hypothetical protein